MTDDQNLEGLLSSVEGDDPRPEFLTSARDRIDSEERDSHTRRRRRGGILAAAAAAALVLIGAIVIASDGDDPTRVEVTESDPAPTIAPSTSTTSTTPPAIGVSCDVPATAWERPGTLTVAISEVEEEAWPNGSYESVMTGELAAVLGFEEEEVALISIPHLGAVQPDAAWNYDVAVQTATISRGRDEVVDFSDGYLRLDQFLLATEGSPLFAAESLSQLRDATLGVFPSAEYSVFYAVERVQPATDPIALPDDGTAPAQLADGVADGVVMDLVASDWIRRQPGWEELEVVAKLPRFDDELDESEPVGEQGSELAGPEELGLVFQEGSELVDCFNDGLAVLRDSGRLEELAAAWYPDEFEASILGP